MNDIETRELRYFQAVAEELHFGRAAARLGIAQPPLSRAIQQLERRLGVMLFDRDRRRVALTPAGATLLRESRTALRAVEAAVRRTRRAAVPSTLRLVTKAGAAHQVLQRLLDAYGREHPDAAVLEVVLCEIGEQAGMLRTAGADAAIMHRPVDDLDGFDTVDLLTEEQVAIVPRVHPLAQRPVLTLADTVDVPGLPLARWPRPDGTYPDGDGPEVRTQSQLAQLIALGRAMLLIPASSRAWQWPEHTAIPVVDAPPITTVLAWPSGSASPLLGPLVQTASGLDATAAADTAHSPQP